MAAWIQLGRRLFAFAAFFAAGFIVVLAAGGAVVLAALGAGFASGKCGGGQSGDRSRCDEGEDGFHGCVLGLVCCRYPLGDSRHGSGCAHADLPRDGNRTGVKPDDRTIFLRGQHEAPRGQKIKSLPGTSAFERETLEGTVLQISSAQCLA